MKYLFTFTFITVCVIGFLLGYSLGQEPDELNTALDDAIAKCYDPMLGGYNFKLEGCEGVRQELVERLSHE